MAGRDRTLPQNARDPAATVRRLAGVATAAAVLALAQLGAPGTPLAKTFTPTRPLSVSTPSAVNVGTGLASGQQLAANRYLLSGNGQYELDMLPKGVGVLWAKLPGTQPCPMWVFPPPTHDLVDDTAWTLSATPSPGDYLVMQDDGNLVFYPPSSSTAIWATGTEGHPGAVALVSNWGFLAVVDPRTKTVLWESSHKTEGQTLGKAAEICMNP